MASEIDEQNLVILYVHLMYIFLLQISLSHRKMLALLIFKMVMPFLRAVTLRLWHTPEKRYSMTIQKHQVKVIVRMKETRVLPHWIVMRMTMRVVMLTVLTAPLHCTAMTMLRTQIMEMSWLPHLTVVAGRIWAPGEPLYPEKGEAWRVLMTLTVIVKGKCPHLLIVKMKEKKMIPEALL